MKVLITAGPVYGRLDDNKLVSNRSRGIWAEKYAERLCDQGHDVTLLVADTYPEPMWHGILHRIGDPVPKVLRQTGFDDYRAQCMALAPEMDVAIMASAVVNWIPAEPIKGKMTTKGYKPGDRVNIPFYLAPHVIDEMKKLNPRITLVGCKMTSGAEYQDMIDAAYDVILHAKANVVVANDLTHGLKDKFLVYQDKTVVPYRKDFKGLFRDLDAVLADEHYHTKVTSPGSFTKVEGGSTFDRIVAKYWDRFIHRSATDNMVLGSICVPQGDNETWHTWLLSPREKGGKSFISYDASIVVDIDGREIKTDGCKATLNAPLLTRVCGKYPTATAILHLHEQLPNVPTVPYAPPGTVRDNDREIPGPIFNIEGHGFIACLDDNLEIWRV